MLEGSEGTHSEDDADAPLEERKMRRKHRNRLSAAASRQRKKEWVETLQEQLRALTAENQLLRQQLAAPSSQAGAAAGLLAFGGGTPAAAHAISADRALGRCLRAHGISEVIHVQVHAEHLGKAAALAGRANEGRPDWGSDMSTSSSASVLDTPDPTPLEAGALPTPMTMPPAMLQLPLKAHPYAVQPSASELAPAPPASGVARDRRPPPTPLGLPAITPAGHPTHAAPPGNNDAPWTPNQNAFTCAKRARAGASMSHDRCEPEESQTGIEPDEDPATDLSGTGAAPFQLDLVRALHSLRAPANAAVMADRPPDHLMRVARVQ